MDLFAAWTAQQESLQAPLLSLWRPDPNTCLAMLKERLGADLFAALWTHARGMSLEQAALYAQKEV